MEKAYFLLVIIGTVLLFIGLIFVAIKGAYLKACIFFALSFFCFGLSGVSIKKIEQNYKKSVAGAVNNSNVRFVLNPTIRNNGDPTLRLIDSISSDTSLIYSENKAYHLKDIGLVKIQP